MVRPVRAALYLRVSSAGQTDGYSLDGQLADCRSYCDRMGYRVVRILRDVGSGRDPERPGFALLPVLAAQRAFDVLVLWRRDRLGRDVVNNALMERELDLAGIRVEAVNTGRLEQTDETELMGHIFDAFAQHEARKIAARCHMGRLGAARAGLWPMAAPFGYSKDEAGRLVLNEPEAARLREAYAEALRGANRARVGLVLGCSGDTAMKRLQSPTNKGQASYDGVPVPCPAVVSVETWDQVQAAIAHRYANRAGYGPVPYSRREARLS